MDVQLIDTTFRDGQQSLWAMGMTTGMIDAVAAEMDEAGFKAVEVPMSPNWFKKFVRDLKEDPWEMLRLAARKMPKTDKAAMGGGFLLGSTPAPRSVVTLFYERAAATGGLNRIQLIGNTRDEMTRYFPWAIPAYKGTGLKVLIALAYTLSPRHTDEHYAEKTRAAVKFRPDGIYLKDQGGLLTPDRVRTLIPVILENAGDIPVEVHSHCTTGLAPLCYMEAVRLGIKTLHTAVPPLANGSAQPSVLNVVHNLRLAGHTTTVNTQVLRPVSERLTAIARQEGLPTGAPVEYDCAQYIHQVPGGVMSSLKFQLAGMRMADRLEAVLAESVAVRKDLGYPIMITPYSQFVVAQATINLLSGERYKFVTDEVIRVAQGYYGEDSGYTWMDPNVRDRILDRARARELASRQPAEPSLKEMREALGGPGVDDEELLLRFIMNGDQEIKAMRAAGPPQQYSAREPLATLLEKLREMQGFQYIRVQKGSDAVVLGRQAVSER